MQYIYIAPLQYNYSETLSALAYVKYLCNRAQDVSQQKLRTIHVGLSWKSYMYQ